MNGGSLFASRRSVNHAQVRSIHAQRQANLPAELRAGDPSAPAQVSARLDRRDDAERTRRDFA